MPEYRSLDGIATVLWLCVMNTEYVQVM